MKDTDDDDDLAQLLAAARPACAPAVAALLGVLVQRAAAGVARVDQDQVARAMHVARATALRRIGDYERGGGSVIRAGRRRLVVLGDLMAWADRRAPRSEPKPADVDELAAMRAAAVRAGARRRRAS
jgi:hypothetical protein